MANETRGILYEAITAVAIEQAMQQAGIAGSVYWNEKPATMNIEPDFTIGTHKDEPTHIVLVTASGSTKESEKKSWRNLGELQEAKAQLATIPTVLNLYFLSEVKAGISDAARRLYDTVLHIDQKPYAPPLAAWVKANLKNAAKDRDARRALLEASIATDPELARAMQQLVTDLAAALGHRNTELDPLWRMMRADYLASSPPPSARPTVVRRGLGKLLVLEPHVRQLVYDNYTKPRGIPVIDAPYAFDLGFFTKTVAGVRLEDREISGALALLGPTNCEAVLRQAPASMMTWVTPLRHLQRINTHVDFIEAHYDDVTNPDTLRELLEQCYDDPASLSGEPSDAKVWVFEIMISLLKAKSGKLQGYGVAELARDTGVSEFGSGGFVLPPFVQRTKMLKPEQLESLAEGLSSRFKSNVARSDLPGLRGKVKDWVIKENLEDRLLPYRNFEPLLWLLQTELERRGKQYTAKEPYVGWIGEYAEAGRKSGTTPFVKVGTTLIHWKSAHKGHCNDKTKELSARARSVKYQYDPETGAFTPRTDVTRLALIVDGDWTERHLQALSNAGWDSIVYPDEIAELVNSL